MAGPVLIAIDLSPSSESIVEAGGRLAVGLGAEVVLVHALPGARLGRPLRIGSVPPSLLEAKAEVQEDRVIDLTTTHAAKLRDQGLQVEAVAREGEAVDVLQEAIREFAPQWVVIGSRRRRGLERMLIGSVADELLRSTDVPVTIVPK